MPFSSISFGLFVLLVCLLVRAVPRKGLRPTLLVASYLYFAAWDWRFLPLLIFSTLIDYLVALRIANRTGVAGNNRAAKRAWLTVSLVAQLGLLGFFKYFNFFLETIDQVVGLTGTIVTPHHLDLVLPLGISFYTFRTLSYTIDVYRGLTPTRSFVDYALYVAFFPTLPAGPIDRAKSFLGSLPSLQPARGAQILEGLNLIAWGLFKKVYVADGLARIIASVYSSHSPSSVDVVVATYGFAVQIFCDFSGYTDIARGCGRCLGLELPENFHQPYLAENPSEFWQRWHITLSTWLRDYVFLPLGGAFGGLPKAYRNLFVTMVLAGLWHGASWTFILWGGYWGLLLVGHRVLQPVLKRRGKWFRIHFPRGLRRWTKTLVTGQLVCLGWLIFRADSLQTLSAMIRALIGGRGGLDSGLAFAVLAFAMPYLLIELIRLGYEKMFPRPLAVVSVIVRTSTYSMVLYLLVFYGSKAEAFIYAQF